MRVGGLGRGPQRVAAWYLLLIVLGAAGALAIALRSSSKAAETAATLLAALGPMYLAWKAFRHDRAEATAVDLETAADQLALAVRKQWDDEAAVRRLNDPYPLPMAWRAADPNLVEPWSLLKDVARGWPGGPPGDPDWWPADATGLAGADVEIGDVFVKRVPTRRLVVLGEPGSGKTTLLIRLLQDLIERRAEGSPVPVLFSLASWNPGDQPLNDWLAGQLRTSYPGLRAPAPGNRRDLAQAVLDAGLVLPLLDGFDELPSALHELGFSALNRDLPAKRPLVLASREADYRATVTRPDAMVRLNGAAGIRLLPLTARDAEAYLRRDAGGPHAPAAERWAGVASQLGTSTPVGQALSTPLGLFLARTIYNPRPGAPLASGPVPHPDELCDEAAFPTRTAVDTHLLNAFIPAAYASHVPNPPRWSAAQAHRVHAFLARHLENNRAGSCDLAWWELVQALPSRTLRLMVALVAFLVIAVASGLPDTLNGGTDGITQGLLFGLIGGVTSGLRFRSAGPNSPSTRLGRSALSLLRRFKVALVVSLTAGAIVSLTAGAVAVSFHYGTRHALLSTLTFLLMYGLPIGLLGAFTRQSTSPNTPSAGFGWSARSLLRGSKVSLVAFVVVFLTVALVGGVVYGVTYGPAEGLRAGLRFGLGFGLMLGLGSGLKAALRAEKPDPTTVVGPTRLLARDRRTFLMAFLGVALALGLASGLPIGLGLDDTLGLTVGLAFGVTGGLVYGVTEAVAWGGFALARSRLALRRQVPWRLMSFLQDAHENRGVLRQVGTVYQFRHLDLQRHLAQASQPPTDR